MTEEEIIAKWSKILNEEAERLSMYEGLLQVDMIDKSKPLPPTISKDEFLDLMKKVDDILEKYNPKCCK